MPIDPNNPVVALCAAGMAVDGTPAEARALFEQAWAARTDDYDACIAAHFLARHQASPAERLVWNERAARHAEAVESDKVAELMPSLYLNLADSLAAVGNVADAKAAAARAVAHLPSLPDDGYRAFLVEGIRRLQARLGPEHAY